MNVALLDFELLAHEHGVLMRHVGHVQARCSELVTGQAAEIERLNAQAMRLHAALIVRDTALAWAREDHAALKASIPGLSKRRTLARHVETLVTRIQDLTRERTNWNLQAKHNLAPNDQPGDPASRAFVINDLRNETLGGLENSLAAADLVICQTGCLSHGAYWYVEDHCKRSGKLCVLIEQPNALHIVRFRQWSTAVPSLCIDAKEI